MSRALRLVAVLVAAAMPLAAIDDPAMARAVALATLAIAAWLLEATPAFVPTLALLGLAPLLIEGVTLGTALGWAADPLLALFFGGFALGRAAGSTGLDQRMAELMVRAARGSARGLVITTAAGGFVTSMWMSSAAAAGVQLAALRPLTRSAGPLATALFLAIAMGTNFGGMVTPIGAGPNALAIAAVRDRAPISFVAWMGLALPLAALLVGAATAAILVAFRVRGRIDAPAAGSGPLDRRQLGLVAVFACAVAAWLSEPLHGVPAASVSVLVAAALFATGLLAPKDLELIDWSTLMLIAGGLVAGRLLERSGALDALGGAIGLAALPALVRTLVVVGLAALLSAVMSNTAAAMLLIPLVSAVDPSPALPVLIAMGCAMGVPFPISTPPNAMVVGAGAPPRALMRIGVPLMIAGVALLTLTGLRVLAWLGIG